MFEEVFDEILDNSHEGLLNNFDLASTFKFRPQVISKARSSVNDIGHIDMWNKQSAKL